MMKWETAVAPVLYNEAILRMEKDVAAIREGTAEECIWLLEHPSLYTAGTSAKASDLLTHDRFPVFESGRGGQYTYHGPGQRIAYVMLDLKKRALPEEPDLRAYVYNLEQWLIETLAAFGVKGERRVGRVGIWVKEGNKENKIAALGIRVRKWVSYHGIALNVAPDLSHFTGIVPCGIREYGVTSLAALGVNVSMEEVDGVLREAFGKVFGENLDTRISSNIQVQSS